MQIKIGEGRKMDYLLLILGFILLIKGADYFVDGSSSVAKLLKVPSIIIGLTVVAFGTSMPELSVSVTAAIKGNNDLAVSNVLGSNIFDLLVVLGCCALVNPVFAEKGIPVFYLYSGDSAASEFRFLDYKGTERGRKICSWQMGRTAFSCIVCRVPVCDGQNGAAFQARGDGRRGRL